ncbi:MAG TPA: glucose-1-phosphate cytidylyltransferase [Gemmatimonadales bacterium]|nr:glucose-1-phosphate cytidylyltransferase [Gemmatimonadales bacterium]
MKVVILAGGFGTRITEESAVRPKPMVEIGGHPILWHIMKIYAAHGLDDFVICCGYKGHVIKEFFFNYRLYMSDITFDLRANTMEVHQSSAEAWRVTLLDTGDTSMTGGRIRRARDHIGGETFCCTYGDGVAPIDMPALIAFHRKQGALATLTAVQPVGRFGAFALGEDETRVARFNEKPEGDGAWVNGGFFVLEPEVIDYIDHDGITFEREPLERLAREGKLAAFRHSGFWQPMDTLRDKHLLESLWASGNPPWKVW